MTNQPLKTSSNPCLNQLIEKLNLDTYSFSYYQALLSKGMALYLAAQSQKGLPSDEYQAIYIAHEGMVEVFRELEMMCAPTVG